MAGISFGGIQSGLDTEAIIGALLAVERQPRTRLVLDETAANARNQALKDIQSRLKTLRTATQDLGSVLLWGPKQTVSSTEDNKVSATLTGGAAPGGYNLKVTALATATQQRHAWTSQATASTLTINGQTVNLDANATLDDAVAAINSNTDTGVFAVNVENKLVLTSRTTGATPTITASGAALTFESNTQGQNARFTVNDGPEIQSESNVVSTAIPGATLTLKSLTAGTTVNVSTPGVDKDAIKDKLKAFVSAYNDALELMSSKTTEKKVVQEDPDKPLSSSDAAKGALFGDQGVNSVISQMRIALTDQVLATGDYRTMAAIGLSTGASSGANAPSADAIKGKLVLDEKALDAALEKDPLAVQTLLGGVSGTDGFSQAFGGVLEPMVAANGTFDQRIAVNDDQLERIKDGITRLDDRLARREETLRKQFTAMELALARSQSQASELFARLGTSTSG